MRFFFAGEAEGGAAAADDIQRLRPHVALALHGMLAAGGWAPCECSAVLHVGAERKLEHLGQLVFAADLFKDTPWHLRQLANGQAYVSPKQTGNLMKSSKRTRSAVARTALTYPSSARWQWAAQVQNLRSRIDGSRDVAMPAVLTEQMPAGRRAHLRFLEVVKTNAALHL